MQEYILSFVVSFVLCGIFMAVLLPILKRLKAGQEILSFVTEHSGKKGTPTMMGIAIVLSIVVSSLIFSDYNSKLLTLSVLVTVAYSIVGFLDDFIKIRYKHNQGLKAYQKIIAQLFVAVAVAVFVYKGGYVNGIKIPFIEKEIALSWLIIPSVIIIFLATTNGVNLTDGLDGLAASVTFVYMLFMGALIYFDMKNLQNSGNTLLSYEYSHLVALCAIIAGSLLAFLIVNTFPAKAFMGDVGSLALGGAVACISIFTAHSLYIILLGIIYVWTCISVILQVGYFKITKGKRIFLMAPYHHHLQQKGMSESRIVILYTAITTLSGCVILYFAVG